MGKKINQPDSRNYLRFSVKILRTVGGWPHLGDFSTIKEVLYHFLTGGAVFTLFFDLVIKCLALYYAYAYQWQCLAHFLEELTVLITAFIVFSKLTIIIINQKKLHNLIRRLNEDLYNRFVRTTDDISIMKACKKHEMKLTYILLTFTYMVASMFTISPVLKTLRDQRKMHALMHAGQNFTMEEFTTAHLPFKLPWEIPRFSPLHMGMYLQQLTTILLTANISVAPDTLFTSLFYYLSGHFDILNARITSEKDILDAKADTINERMEQKKYEQCIAQHRALIRLCDEVTKISKPIIILQLLLSSLMICLGVFQITLISDGNPIQYVKMGAYFLIKVSQLFLYCWHGQELIEKSVQISDSCYSNSWYHSTKWIKLDAKFIIMRSQKALTLSAGGFFSLSFKTFTNVLRTAYSYFALLQTLNEG